MTFTSDELRAMLAQAEQAETAALAAATAAANDRLGAALAAAIRDTAALAAAGHAAGLATPDLAAVLAAQIQRATPVTPDALAAVVAPDALPAPVAPVATAGGSRRTRRRIERIWTAVESGSIWTATLAGQTGRVKITVDPDGNGATFLATTGARGSFRSPSRAVQSATGHPAGAGRKGEATVNGFLALTRDPDGNGPVTLDSVTAV